MPFNFTTHCHTKWQCIYRSMQKHAEKGTNDVTCAPSMTFMFHPCSYISFRSVYVCVMIRIALMYNGLVSFEHAGIHNYNNMQYCNTISAQNTAQVLTSKHLFLGQTFLDDGVRRGGKAAILQDFTLHITC